MWTHLEYEEGGPAEAAQQDHDDAQEPATAAVVGRVGNDVASGMLGPWEVEDRAAEEYHEQRSADCDHRAGDLRLAPPLLDVYSLHPTLLTNFFQYLLNKYKLFINTKKVKQRIAGSFYC